MNEQIVNLLDLMEDNYYYPLVYYTKKIYNNLYIFSVTILKYFKILCIMKKCKVCSGVGFIKTDIICKKYKEHISCHNNEDKISNFYELCSTCNGDGKI